MSPFGTIDELETALRAADYLPDRGLSTALFLALALEKPLLLEGRGGRRQDRGREGARRNDERAPDPAPVLRGARRRPRRLRVELPAPAAAHPRRAGGNRLGGRALRARVPDPPAAARGDRHRRARGAPDRRDRPRRRGVRGVPARGALRLPDHDPRARHDQRAPQAGGDPHLQPDARAARRPQAPGAVPLDRPSVDRPRDRDRQDQDPGHLRAPRLRGGSVRARAARPRSREAAGRRRDDRLGDGPQRARPPGDRRRCGRADARLGAEVPRGHRGRARRDAGAARRHRPRDSGPVAAHGRRRRPPRRHLRSRPARGRPRGRPGPGRGRVAWHRRRRPDPPGGRLLRAAPDARLAPRRARSLRPRLQRVVPACARAAARAHRTEPAGAGEGR